MNADVTGEEPAGTTKKADLPSGGRVSVDSAALAAFISNARSDRDQVISEFCCSMEEEIEALAELQDLVDALDWRPVDG